MTPLTADLVHDVTEADTMDIAKANGSPLAQSFDHDQVQGMGELQGVLEALLFVSSEPLSLARLVAVMGNVSKVEVEEAWRNIGQALEQEGR